MRFQSFFHAGHDPAILIVALLLHHKIHGLIDREAAWLLTRWELLEGCEMLSDDRLRWHENKSVLNEIS